MTPRQKPTNSHSPKKSLGQHFLTDSNILNRIVEVGDFSADDEVVEIGSGLGSLTLPLCQKVKKVIAIELDRDLAEDLRRKNLKNLTVVTGDALTIDWQVDIARGYKLIGNIPYSITSPLIRKILSLKPGPSESVLLIQKEVADRIMAQPGSSERGLLTLLVESRAKVEKIFNIKAGSFNPPPKVESTVIRLTPLDKPVFAQIYWPGIEAGFRHKRQTLANALNKELGINKSELQLLFRKCGISAMARAENLTLENWIDLSDGLQNKV